MNMNMNMGMGGAPGGMDAAAGPAIHPSERKLLNTYIYDYFLKNDMLDCAKTLLKSTQPSELTLQDPKDRPKSENQMNGVDDDAMDTGDGSRAEMADNAKSTSDLPKPHVPTTTTGSFLFEWWCCFMDIYFARMKNGQATAAAQAYVQQVGRRRISRKTVAN